MSHAKSRSQRRAAYIEKAGEMYDRLEDWYEEHPEASFGEIESQARHGRRGLMGETLRILVNERDRGFQLTAPRCKKCGEEMEFEGYRDWTVHGLEGDTKLKRAYYVCPECRGETFFPPGSQTETESRSLE
jgi:hypothetical protein